MADGGASAWAWGSEPDGNIGIATWGFDVGDIVEVSLDTDPNELFFTGGSGVTCISDGDGIVVQFEYTGQNVGFTVSGTFDSISVSVDSVTLVEAAPTPTPKPAPTATNTPTPTPKPANTPTNTPKPVATATPKPATATATPKPAATATPRPAATATPKPAATATPRPAATATPKPAATSTSTPAASGATNTPVPASVNDSDDDDDDDENTEATPTPTTTESSDVSEVSEVSESETSEVSESAVQSVAAAVEVTTEGGTEETATPTPTHFPKAEGVVGGPSGKDDGGKGFPWWILIVLALLGAGGYRYYSLKKQNMSGKDILFDFIPGGVIGNIAERFGYSSGTPVTEQPETINGYLKTSNTKSIRPIYSNTPDARAKEAPRGAAPVGQKSAAELHELAQKKAAQKAAAATAPGLKAPIKRPKELSVNHAAQSAAPKAAPAPVKPAANTASAPRGAAPVGQKSAAELHELAQKKATQKAAATTAPGLKAPIKRPKELSVNHAAQAAANKPVPAAPRPASHATSAPRGAAPVGQRSAAELHEMAEKKAAQKAAAATVAGSPLANKKTEEKMESMHEEAPRTPGKASPFAAKYGAKPAPAKEPAPAPAAPAASSPFKTAAGSAFAARKNAEELKEIANKRAAEAEAAKKAAERAQAALNEAEKLVASARQSAKKAAEAAPPSPSDVIHSTKPLPETPMGPVNATEAKPVFSNAKEKILLNTAAQVAFKRDLEERNVAPAIATSIIPPVVEKNDTKAEGPSPFKPAPKPPVKRNLGEAPVESQAAPAAAEAVNIPKVAQFDPVVAARKTESPFVPVNHSNSDQMSLTAALAAKPLEEDEVPPPKTFKPLAPIPKDAMKEEIDPFKHNPEGR
ncbi:MAG: hypothetical protein IJ869_01455 [Clostridiales bacterium]|nr:hypothetical protein [Clostridiales bacterium]